MIRRLGASLTGGKVSSHAVRSAASARSRLQLADRGVSRSSVCTGHSSRTHLVRLPSGTAVMCAAANPEGSPARRIRTRD